MQTLTDLNDIEPFMKQFGESLSDIIGEPRRELLPDVGKIFLDNDNDDLEIIYCPLETQHMS